MKKIKFLMVIISITIMGLMSCKKINDDPIKKPHEYVKAISVQVDAIDNDIISGIKTTPMSKSGDYNSTSRAWYLYKNIDGVLSLVDGTEFVPDSDPNVYWVQPSNNPLILTTLQSLVLAYAPDLDLKMVYKTRNTAGQTVYLGVNDFHPVEDVAYTMAMTGRQLRDVFYVDAHGLQVNTYKLELTFNYTLSTIDEEATIAVCASTTDGWPTYVYSSSTPVTAVISATKNTLTYVGFTKVGNDIQLYNDLGKKVTGTIQCVCVVKDKNNKTVKTITNNYPANEIGIGKRLIFTSLLIGWENGETTFSDIAITITDENITIR